VNGEGGQKKPYGGVRSKNLRGYRKKWVNRSGKSAKGYREIKKDDEEGGQLEKNNREKGHREELGEPELVQKTEDQWKKDDLGTVVPHTGVLSGELWKGGGGKENGVASEKKEIKKNAEKQRETGKGETSREEGSSQRLDWKGTEGQGRKIFVGQGQTVLVGRTGRVFSSVRGLQVGGRNLRGTRNIP